MLTTAGKNSPNKSPNKRPANISDEYQSIYQYNPNYFYNDESSPMQIEVDEPQNKYVKNEVKFKKIILLNKKIPPQQVEEDEYKSLLFIERKPDDDKPTDFQMIYDELLKAGFGDTKVLSKGDGLLFNFKKRPT